ncbi:hypothetical protein LMG26858_00863 [Achromobacter anxifer]|uniref:Mu-like prophage protein gp37 n=1 Tax=Achromobacter anxifer TaxID=1287737 RepID=A0A6S7D6J5_9BURK|nr:phage protein Gp37 [Achromobacter anxifer]CAB3834447.1 hypothetical protein LMG26858_00863 [Achromobacter anxifer]
MSPVVPRDIYTRIELAMSARLAAGLRGLVKGVTTYSGEMDDDLARIAAAMPAAWVTFGGILGTKPYSTSQQKWVATGKFVVMIGQTSIRSDAAARHGTGRPSEIGANALAWAVRRLLIGQELTDQDATLRINPLRPGRARTLFNTQLQGKPVTVYAVEFETDWIEEALPKQRFPSRGEGGGPAQGDDAIFDAYPPAARSGADPDLLSVHLHHHLTPMKDQPDATDIVQFKKEDE